MGRSYPGYGPHGPDRDSPLRLTMVLWPGITPSPEGRQMQTVAWRLSGEQILALRARHPYEQDVEPILELARRRGWLEANLQYLRDVRFRAREAMQDLMRELGVFRAPSPSQAIELVALACQVFTPDGGFSGSLTRESENSLRITTEPCPVYRSLEERGWCGVSACPSWHRRRGWLDALGVEATDSVVAEMRWGDPACVTVIEVKEAA